jgi:YidC/Oxa1 family membrane protein insertase
LDIGEIWSLIAVRPVMNILIVLSHYFFNSFGLAIIALTIVIRGAMYPLSARQLKSTKAMNEMQPKLMALQKKYTNDRQKLASEQMRLYREAGMNPVGCLGPMVIQLPIWIALYQSIIRVLAVAPEDFLNLSQDLYSWAVIYTRLPLNNSFLWLNLAVPDTILVLPILVAGTMWIQQKMILTKSSNPQQRQQSQIMLWMMPLMFGMLTMQFPSGLALYWVASNTISIVIQYFIGGWGGLADLPYLNSIIGPKKPAKYIATSSEPPPAETSQDIEGEDTRATEETPARKSAKRQATKTSNPRQSRSARRKSRRTKN